MGKTHDIKLDSDGSPSKPDNSLRSALRSSLHLLIFAVTVAAAIVIIGGAAALVKGVLF